MAVTGCLSLWGPRLPCYPSSIATVVLLILAAQATLCHGVSIGPRRGLRYSDDEEGRDEIPQIITAHVGGLRFEDLPMSTGSVNQLGSVLVHEKDYVRPGRALSNAEFFSFFVNEPLEGPPLDASPPDALAPGAPPPGPLPAPYPPQSCKVNKTHTAALHSQVVTLTILASCPENYKVELGPGKTCTCVKKTTK